jgi:hypothetical protein
MGQGERELVWVGLKRELVSWAGDVAGVLDMRAHGSTVVREEGGADRGVPWRSEERAG